MCMLLYVLVMLQRALCPEAILLLFVCVSSLVSLRMGV